jgi:hypothetical protein
MGTIIGSYAISLVTVGALCVLLGKGLRQAVIADVKDLGLAASDLCVVLWFWPSRVAITYGYQPRHATYAPATRAWSMTL